MLGTFGESLRQTGRDGGLADAALLVADDEAANGLGRSGRVLCQPKGDRLCQALDVGDLAGSAVRFEFVVEAFGQVGAKGLCTCGINCGELVWVVPPGLDACGNGVLDIRAELRSADFECLSECGG